MATTSPAAFAADAPKAAVKKTVVKDLILKGDAKCTECHDEADSPDLLSISRTRHGVTADSRTPTCTKCHGESDSHVGYKGSGKPPTTDVSFGKKSTNTAQQQAGSCLSCHDGDNKRTHWEGSKHQIEGVSCTSCHQVHVQKDKVMAKTTQSDVCFSCHKTERAESKKVSAHPLSKIGCSGCHNTHGSAGTKMVKKNTVNETCFTCHAEKRGPFLFEHQPVTEDCGTCHSPHGSNLAPLLKARPNFLCQECHNEIHQAKTPFGGGKSGGFQGGLTVFSPLNNTAAAPGVGNLGAQCLNCHSVIHGSNSPSGMWFHR